MQIAKTAVGPRLAIHSSRAATMVDAINALLAIGIAYWRMT
jgi:hypothetical protein